MEKLAHKKNLKSDKRFRCQRLSKISSTKMELSIYYSYQSTRFWGTYLSKYTDLFLSDQETEQRARTHSLVMMCRNLRYRHGCSFKSIYLGVLKMVGETNASISTDILKLDSRWSFIDSLFEV